MWHSNATHHIHPPEFQKCLVYSVVATSARHAPRQCTPKRRSATRSRTTPLIIYEGALRQTTIATLRASSTTVEDALPAQSARRSLSSSFNTRNATHDEAQCKRHNTVQRNTPCHFQVITDVSKAGSMDGVVAHRLCTDKLMKESGGKYGGVAVVAGGKLNPTGTGGPGSPPRPARATPVDTSAADKVGPLVLS
jgi:hypothetical protein